jgi:hypothetical protein
MTFQFYLPSPSLVVCLSVRLSIVLAVGCRGLPQCIWSSASSRASMQRVHGQSLRLQLRMHMRLPRTLAQQQLSPQVSARRTPKVRARQPHSLTRCDRALMPFYVGVKNAGCFTKQSSARAIRVF